MRRHIFDEVEIEGEATMTLDKADLEDIIRSNFTFDEIMEIFEGSIDFDTVIGLMEGALKEHGLQVVKIDEDEEVMIKRMKEKYTALEIMGKFNIVATIKYLG